MDFEIDTYEHGHWWVVAVHGEVDVASAPRLREAVIELVGRNRTQIVVDLEGVDFIDSTGLGVLVGALKRVKTHQGDLRIVCSNPRVSRVFEITGLDAVFLLAPTFEAATSP